MSAGDIDNVLADAKVLKHLRQQHPDLDAYLTRAYLFIPCSYFFIPYGAGISEDGETVYVSNDIQAMVDGTECVSGLVYHEVTEWGVRHYCQIGEDYQTDPTGHRIANRAESNRVRQILSRPDAWEIYSEIIDSQVEIDERQDLTNKPVPRDLAMYPYDEALQDKLRDAMFNDRSIEMWDRFRKGATDYSDVFHRE